MNREHELFNSEYIHNKEKNKTNNFSENNYGSKKRKGAPISFHRSAAVLHSVSKEPNEHEEIDEYKESKKNKENKKELTGYKEGLAEKKESKNFKEVVSMSNSFGNVAMGFNEHREFMLTVSEKQRANEKVIKNDNKRVDGSRSKQIHHHDGQIITNNNGTADTAVALRTNVDITMRKMNDMIGKTEQSQNQQAIDRVLPQFRSNKEYERLLEIRRDEREIHEKGTDNQLLKDISKEKQYLEQTLAKEKRMDLLLRKKITLGLNKSRKSLENMEEKKLRNKEDIVNSMLIKKKKSSEDDANINEDNEENKK